MPRGVNGTGLFDTMPDGSSTPDVPLGQAGRGGRGPGTDLFSAAVPPPNLPAGGAPGGMHGAYGRPVTMAGLSYAVAPGGLFNTQATPQNPGGIPTWIGGIPYMNGQPMAPGSYVTPGGWNSNIPAGYFNPQGAGAQGAPRTAADWGIPTSWSATGSPSQWLAGLAGNNSYLTNFAQNGQPVNALPAWQSYVDAQQRNLQSNAANLMEMFNNSGGYQSTSFGNAATDFWTQASKDQNALLAQMGYQSLSDAVGRQYGASQMLGQQAYGGASQLAGYDFQSQMAQYNAALNAAMMGSQQTYGAANTLGGYGNAAANSLLANSLYGTGQLFGTSNSAASQMYGAGMNMLPTWMQYDSTLRGQNITGANALGGLYQGNLGLGAQIGTGQYNMLQQQIAAAYQEWLRTQPGYNPLIPYMYQGATGYAPTTTTTTPGFWDYFTQILGAGIGAAGSIIGGGALSDERAKENLVPLGKLDGMPIYSYNYIGDPTRHIGVIAQEAAVYHPHAVHRGDATTPWTVNYEQLMLEVLANKGGVN